MVYPTDRQSILEVAGRYIHNILWSLEELNDLIERYV